MAVVLPHLAASAKVAASVAGRVPEGAILSPELIIVRHWAQALIVLPHVLILVLYYTFVLVQIIDAAASRFVIRYRTMAKAVIPLLCK